MNFIKQILKGFVIGIGNIAPGVSGGALALILGVYEDLVDAVGNFFKDIKKNVLFLLPIGIGGGLAVIIFSGIIEYLLKTHTSITAYTFAGLITGTLPILFKQATKKGMKPLHIIPFLVTLAGGLALVFVQEGLAGGNLPTEVTMTVPVFLMFILYGFVMAGSMVIPGISGSVLMMLFGVYQIILHAIKSLDILVCMPFGIGLVIGVLFFSKLMGYLLKHLYTVTFFAILGFVIGSIPEFMPGIKLDRTGITSIIFFICGALVSYMISTLDKREA